MSTNARVDSIIETWYCCREWPIVVATVTHGKSGIPKREAWFVRKCGLCKEYPRPRKEVTNGNGEEQ